MLHCRKQSKRLGEQTFIERIENKGYLGCIFELKFKRYFAEGRELTVGTKKTIKLKRLGYETFSSSCNLELGVLYQPNKSNFHGLDFFFLAKNKNNKKIVLNMLQTTVADKSHSPLKFDHADIKGLVSCITKQKFTIASYTMIYVLPLENANFKVPKNRKRQ